MAEHAAPVQAVQAPAPQSPAQNGFHLQRKCACGSYGTGGGTCDKCRKDGSKLQRTAASPPAPEALPSMVYDVLGSSGQPLDLHTRAWLEPRFGHDFSSVRVHTDARAAESARAVNALAYTVGDDVVFDSGQYAPRTERGGHLLAHELTHVVQQSRGGASVQQAKAISEPSDAAEIEADAMADRVMTGDEVSVTQAPSATLHAARGDTETVLGAVFGAVAAGVVGISIAAIAGGFDREKFTDDELVEYLTVLATTHRIEGTSTSDNKARNVVSRWNAPNKFDVNAGFSTGKASLTATELKRLLIREMIDGPTGESDQLAIIAVFTKSKSEEVEALLDPTQGLALQDIETEMSEKNLSALLTVLNEKLPDIGKPQVKRSETAQTGECSAGRAIKLSFAHQRAEDAVAHAITLLDEFIAKPDGNTALLAALNCYFNKPTADQVKQIRSDFAGMKETLSKITYVCPAEPFVGYTVRDTTGVKSYKPEKDLWMRAPVDLAEGEGRTFKNVVFPDFFGIGPKDQARACAHESFHHLKRHGETAPDEYEPSCGALSTDFALNNADSYAQLAMALESVNPSASGQQKKGVQRKAGDNDTPDEVPDVVDDVLRTPGQPLDATTRTRMESRFDRDFSEVRVHTDSASAESARAVNAHAYTVGQDVVFNTGQYEPGTDQGARLLAHELTHVVQQSENGPTATQTAKPISEPDDAAEVEADRVAEVVLNTDAAVEVSQSPSAAVHADPLTGGQIAGLVAGGVALGGVAAGLIVAAAIGAFDSSKFRNCNPDQQTVINAATDTAKQWIDNAVQKVDAVLNNPKAADEFVLQQLRTHFKITADDKENVKKVREGLGQMQAGFGKLEFECDSACGETDKSAVPARVPGLLGGITLKYGRIHVCPRFFREAQNPEDRRPDEKADTIAHEMAHRFVGARGDVYRQPPEDDRYAQKYKDLTTSEALENADSYAQFAKNVFNITQSHAPEPATGAAKETTAPKAGEVKRKAIRSGVSRKQLQRQPKGEPPPPLDQEPEPAPEKQAAPETQPTPEKKPEPAPQPEQLGGIPKVDPTRGMAGYPPDPRNQECFDILWAREYERIFRLDTVSVIGVTAKPASEKKADVTAAQNKNQDLAGALVPVCRAFENEKHPFRVHVYYLDSDPRNEVGEPLKEDHAKANRELGETLHASQTPAIRIFVERNLEREENFSDAKTLTASVKTVIADESRSAARRGAVTGLKVGTVVGGLTALGVGIGVGAAISGGGGSTGAALGWGALAGAVAGGVVLGLSAAIGATIGAIWGTDRGTKELSKERIKEVQTFVALLRKTGEVKGDPLTNSDADNLARDAITLWIDSPATMPLTVKDRRLLILVMLDGPTMDDDERAIIKLLENSTDAEVLQILDPTASDKERVTLQRLDEEIDGQEWKETKKMLDARFPTLGAPAVQRTETATEPKCESTQAMMVVQALKRAGEMVPIAIQRLTEYLGDPEKEKAVLGKIQCYFPGAAAADVQTIKGLFEKIQGFIPTGRYVCVSKKPLPVRTPDCEDVLDCSSRPTSADVAFTLACKVPKDGKITYVSYPETYLCPVFFENGPIYQATSLIHEWVHHVIPESDVEDYGPKCGAMELAKSLINPDSYALLARDLSEGIAAPANAPATPSVKLGNFRNMGAPTPENRCLSCPNIPTLGPNPTSGENFMELRGDITGHRPDALYDFKRTKEVAVWMRVKGAWKEARPYEPPGTLDDASADDEDAVPKADRIYTIDGPGLRQPMPLPAPPEVEGGVYKGNFVESVNVKVGNGPWTPSSDTFKWHSLFTFERATDGLVRRAAKGNEIEPDHITIGSGPPSP